MRSFAEEGIAFTERCATANAAAAADDFNAAIKRMGFEVAACGAWVGVGPNRKSRFFFVTWPRDWLEFYEKKGYFAHDPAVAEG